MSNFPWLTIIVPLPISAGLSIPLLPNKGNRIIRWYTLGICLVEFLPITHIFCNYFHFDNQFIELKEDYNWINFLDFHWRLGIDGLSIGLILLTGFITTLATSAAWPITRNPRLSYFLMLAMYSGQVGLSASQDISLSFFMWELELIPVYLLLSMWGGKRRLYAATKFILYTAGSFVSSSMGALTMGLYGSDGPTLDFENLANRCYLIGLEIILYLGFFIAYAVKLLMIPLHTWLPDTHGEVYYSTCMLLAGILLKMGGYGSIRINMELLSHAYSIFVLWLVIIGAIQIVYSASTFLSQLNLKRRIAYLLVSHMGFVLIGIGPTTDIGVNGAISQMISHGLIGAAPFFPAGVTYDRTRTLFLNQMGGIATSIPKISTMFSSFSMAFLALPGLSGFVAELMIFSGIVSSQNFSFLFKVVIIIVAATGIILTPIYLLSMLRQMFYGYRIIKNLTSYVTDAGPREIFIFICLFFPIIGIGFYLKLVPSLSNSKVEFIISGNFSSK
uniref:NADH dehydrogenase ND4 subunit n=2 Tax=Anthoceros TaxID=3233 RepID=A0A6M8B1W3_ANTPU|nr:NADH dehydrogenase ND4 subunit [Anthoceros punctatus]YP_009863105.1 NADH dehydrogenase ND4 subunit [Anthoceros agrestis]QKD76470.1 NADH dehydrogenase ND4 subunit [Anthoceros punctatus]QKD76560.1 NADH dehydrogenase ND4 subunit [Anthoceros agrestis]